MEQNNKNLTLAKLLSKLRIISNSKCFSNLSQELPLQLVTILRKTTPSQRTLFRLCINNCIFVEPVLWSVTVQLVKNLLHILSPKKEMFLSPIRARSQLIALRLVVLLGLVGA
jgi:hypothetical protein